MKIKFCGAAQTVTGSQHLLEINGKKILLDCGMFQGKREESYKMNRQFLFDPAKLDCVLLSHAHIDHSGNLPTLSLKGFRGSVYATPATRDLCSILLQDCAHIIQKDTEFVNKRRKKNREILFNPLYTIENVLDIMTHFKAIPYKKTFFPDGFDGNVSVTFVDAGHILGSSQIILDIKENNKTIRLGFTGDLGRYNLPILNDPEYIGNVDILITESTYGGKEHDPAEQSELQLENAIKESVNTHGKIIVPAFSVGRTQEIVYTLAKLFEKKSIPDIPIYVDSPLSIKATEIFRIHSECYDKETADLISNGVDIFREKHLRYINDAEESKKLNNLKEPCVIISASGMCESGRILHHLVNNIENPDSIILIIGFMAEHTLGRRLVESSNIANSTVKIYGDEYKVRAKIKILNSFSAHADKNELRRYLGKFDRNKLKKLFIVHGEPDQQEILREDLIKTGIRKIETPYRGQEFEI